MNKQIYELAEQAGMERAGYANGTKIMTWREGFDNPGSLEKFAELIVRECARVARATPAPNFHEHLNQQLGHTWDMACLESGREIVKHFGVE